MSNQKQIKIYGLGRTKVSPHKQRYWQTRKDGVKQRYWQSKKEYVFKKVVRVDKAVKGTGKELKKAVKEEYEKKEWEEFEVESPWECPNCSTWNTTNICSKCGYKK